MLVKYLSLKLFVDSFTRDQFSWDSHVHRVINLIGFSASHITVSCWDYVAYFFERLKKYADTKFNNISTTSIDVFEVSIQFDIPWSRQIPRIKDLMLNRVEQMQIDLVEVTLRYGNWTKQFGHFFQTRSFSVDCEYRSIIGPVINRGDMAVAVAFWRRQSHSRRWNSNLNYSRYNLVFFCIRSFV